MMRNYKTPENQAKQQADESKYDINMAPVGGLQNSKAFLQSKRALHMNANRTLQDKLKNKSEHQPNNQPVSGNVYDTPNSALPRPASNSSRADSSYRPSSNYHRPNSKSLQRIKSEKIVENDELTLPLLKGGTLAPS